MGTWAGIVRVSHTGGRNGDRFHADAEQVEAIERYTLAHGANLELLTPELDTSGGLPLAQRPSLLQAVEGVESGQYEAVVVAYLSRLGRSMKLLEVWDRVEGAGGRIIAVQEGIDTSTPTGRHMRNLLLSQAAMEREQHAERHAERRRKTVEAGIWRVRQTPRGYTRDLKTRRLVPDERRAEVVAAFEDRGRGMDMSAIADRLKMTTSGVRQMLRNRVYLGELHDGDHVNPAAHPPLIDVATFEAAQTSVPRPARSMSGPALLAGLIRCAGCGHVMSRKRTATVVYACAGRHSGGRCPAPASVTAALIDAHVEAVALEELRRLSVTAADGRGVERAQAKLEQVEGELSAYLEAVSAAELGANAFGAGARTRSHAVDDARGELRAELARQPVMPLTGTGAEVWESLDGHERNQLLRALLGAVVVQRAGGRGARVPLADRVRVLRHGARLDDFDDEDVLRVPAGEDAL